MRIFRRTKSAISSNFRLETKVQRKFAIKSVGLLPTARNFALDRHNCLPCDLSVI